MGKRVLLLIPTPTAFGRDVVSGILRYNREHGHWRLLHEALFPAVVPESLSEWRPDGILALINGEPLLGQLRSLDLPVINVGQNDGQPDLRTVHADNEAAGAVAAEHFLERGFRSLAFCGIEGRPFSEQRAAGFRRRAAEAGIDVPESHLRGLQSPTMAQEAALVQWLRSLPKPIGLYTCLDRVGAMTIELATSAGLRVPEDVAIVGTDNDQLVCDMTYPPLSSVDIASDRRGYEAAAWLDRLMSGRSERPGAPIVRKIPPRGVVTRLSSDMIAVADSEVAAAVRFIREQAHRQLRVTDLLRVVPMSRRGLERRFREYLGHLPADEIRRVRLSKARTLLAETDLSLQEIARRSGLRTVKSLSDIFSRHMGETTTEFRKKHQRRA